MPASTPRPGFPLTSLTNSPLQRAVHHRAVVEQAKGVLILLYRIDAEQAFDVLRAWAKETESSVVTVAQTLVHAVCLEDDGKEWDRVVRDHVRAAVGRLDGVRLPLPRRGSPTRPRLRTIK